MQIVIEIPDEVKEAFDKANIADVDCYVNDYDLLLGKAIKNGTPLPKGHWIIDDEDNYCGYRRIWACHCSVCNQDPQDNMGGSENWWLIKLPKHCPHCGAKMEVEDADSN